MKYHVDFNNLDEYKNRLDDDINIIKDELYKVLQAHSELDWIGPSYDSMTNNLYNRLETLNKMVNVLDLISDFLSLASDNYSDGINEIKKHFEKALQELNLDKQKRGI